MDSKKKGQTNEVRGGGEARKSDYSEIGGKESRRNGP